jgi:hypothetical protein
MINIGHSMIEDPEKDDVLDSLDGIYNVSTRALDCLANLAGYQTMQIILEIFAQKIVQNLIQSAGSTE